MADKLPLFYAWTDLNTIQQIGGSFVTQIKNYFPDIGSVAVEIAAWTIIFQKFNIAFPYWILIAFIIGKKYFWMVCYYLAGLFIKKVGLLKAQSLYLETEENLNPAQRQTIDLLNAIAKAVKADTKEIEVYKRVKLKEIPKEFKQL